MDYSSYIGSAGSAFASVIVLATYSMKTMIPLRVFGILSNIVFIITSLHTGTYVITVLHCVMLPLNTVRLFQMLRLVRGVKSSLSEDLNMDWLKPFMTKHHCRKGDVLFAKDAVADEMYYTLSGRYRLTEMGIDIPPGQIIGELGMLAPSNRRTASFECIEDGVLLTVTYQQVKELYFQNPEFGFYFLRLATARLFDNIARLQTQVEQLRPAHT
ncbi:MAG: cyclic nucleotide-binding domain-containing protein [Xanthobacteraceae bacterium]|nr:cyclic nucleotide-binding domain-containing protein [Xanthobacteraceae bacterium]